MDKSDERPNIIFTSLCSLSSSIDVYGGKLKTNVISKIARSGTVYMNAISAGTYTMPSNVSLFTGKRVRKIGSLMKDPIKNADANTDPYLVKNRYIRIGEMTLAKKMNYLGYKTALFSNNPFISRTTGLAEGFSYVDNLWFRRKIDTNRDSIKLTLKLIGSDKARKYLINLAYLISKGIPKKNLDNLYLRLRTNLNKRFAKDRFLRA